VIFGPGFKSSVAYTFSLPGDRATEKSRRALTTWGTTLEFPSFLRLDELNRQGEVGRAASKLSEASPYDPLEVRPLNKHFDIPRFGFSDKVLRGRDA
jgi:hypothetical protein